MTRSRAYGWAQNHQQKRSARSREMDSRRKAQVTFREDLGTKEYSKWKRHPGRYDIEGIDTPERTKRSTVEELGLRPDRGEREREYRERHTFRMENIIDPDGSSYPAIHNASPIEGKPKGSRCPYCGGTRWGPSAVSLRDDGIRRYAECSKCGQRSEFHEFVPMTWADRLGDWAIGPVPSHLASKGRKMPQVAVYRAVPKRNDPEVYVIWSDGRGDTNLYDVASKAGFSKDLTDRVSDAVFDEGDNIRFAYLGDESVQPRRTEKDPRYRTDPSNPGLSRWGLSASRRRGGR